MKHRVAILTGGDEKLNKEVLSGLQKLGFKWGSKDLPLDHQPGIDRGVFFDLDTKDRSIYYCDSLYSLSHYKESLFDDYYDLRHLSERGEK